MPADADIEQGYNHPKDVELETKLSVASVANPINQHTSSNDTKANAAFRSELSERHKQISNTLQGLIGNKGIGSKKIKLEFSDIEVKIGPRKLLKGITASAHPGQVLSIMGPSGSGKTTLLNSLAGRIKTSNGKILLNGRPPVKAMKRYIAYVLQDEMFFGTMTVREVMYFTARIRLPESMKDEEKIGRADEIMTLLGIGKCCDSIVGTPFQRGISGGERKRLNIAVQLITWPSLILLDEPTSGLDSSTSLDLLLTLKELAKNGCTVITTIHQPSSAVFNLFDNLLVLADGHTFYYGNAEGVVERFNERGFLCPRTYNPGDFVLELAKSKAVTDAMFTANNATGGVIDPSVHARKPGQMDHTMTKKASLGSITEKTLSKGEEMKEVSISTDSADLQTDWNDSFASSWTTQFKALLTRAFIVKKHSAFDNVDMFQVVVIALIVGLVWFRQGNSEDAIQDRFGLVFFIGVFWAFFPMFQSIMTFPTERAILLRERAQGAYRLSAYYTSKVVAEIPLNVINPSLFILICYYMAGVNDDPRVFFSFWFTLILNVETSAALGMLISASQTNIKKALVAASILILFSMLIAGFYVNSDNIPTWLRWIEWLSYLKYTFGSLATQVFNPDLEFSCGSPSQYSVCQDGNNGPITGTDVLEVQGVANLPLVYPVVLMGIYAFARISTYFVLFYRYKPKVQ
ncbi:hypothetical protein AAMO2058_000126200 [Amorphochlora amoebiformis]